MQPMPDVGPTLFGAMALIWGVFALAGFVLFLWALIDCVQREFKDPTTKIVWILVIVLVGLIGPIVYLIVGRPTGRKGIAPPSAPQGPPA